MTTWLSSAATSQGPQNSVKKKKKSRNASLLLISLCFAKPGPLIDNSGEKKQGRMYADLVEAGAKRSMKERLDADFTDDFPARSRPASGKRQRQSDDLWKHDLYEDREGPQTSKTRVGAEDLRSKLQKKSAQQAYQGGRVRDLREKLSGTMQSPPAVTAPPKAKLASENSKPVKKSAPSVEETVLDTKKVSASTSSRKKYQRKSDSSVDGFLKLLGLEKYSITLQAEEVDMAALRHMTEDDLRALGIPMGPRKKILLALDSKS